MSDQTLDKDAELEEGAEEEQLPPKKRWSGKRIVLFVVLPAMLVLGGGAGVWFGGLLDFLGSDETVAEADEDAMEEAPPPPGETVFLELPDLLVNLNTEGRRTSFLKIKVSLEVGKEEDVKHLESVMPRIVDNFHVYLRELRAEDLRGSAGLYRLREELLARVRTIARPVEIRDVLFKEMLVQ